MDNQPGSRRALEGYPAESFKPRPSNPHERPSLENHRLPGDPAPERRFLPPCPHFKANAERHYGAHDDRKPRIPRHASECTDVAQALQGKVVPEHSEGGHIMTVSAGPTAAPESAIRSRARARCQITLSDLRWSGPGAQGPPFGADGGSSGLWFTPCPKDRSGRAPGCWCRQAGWRLAATWKVPICVSGTCCCSRRCRIW